MNADYDELEIAVVGKHAQRQLETMQTTGHFSQRLCAQHRLQADEEHAARAGAHPRHRH